MEIKGSKSNNSVTKKQRLKARNRRFQIQILTIICLVILIGGIFLNKIYVSYKCQNITYAIDYYFTKANKKDYRLLRVSSITLLKEDKDTVEIEVAGLSEKKPRQSLTLIGEFTKDENGRWKIANIKHTNE